MHHPLRLRCDGAAFASNYKKLQALAGVPAGAAIKANAYGLGAPEAARFLLHEGCRNFFVSSWWEAEELAFLPPDSLAVLHGFGADDHLRPGVRPVLISAEQVACWKASGHAHLPCDLMVDTGMNRLGLRLDELSSANGLNVHTLHSHLACADEESWLNEAQLKRFREVVAVIPARRASLSNSAGIFLGQNFSFDLVRPGLALYGGVPRPEARMSIQAVVTPEAQVLQRSQVEAGSSIGYNATFVAPKDMSIAILNVGYADGFWRALGQHGRGIYADVGLPVVGRVSMDLIAIDVSAAPDLGPGDWVKLSFDLEQLAAQSGLSQYELLTGLGRRWERQWS